MIATEPVRRQRDAHGARCSSCAAVFSLATCPYWSWTKSAAMHRAGSGHAVTLFRIVASA